MAVLSTTETGGKLIPPPENFVGKANCPSYEAYQEMYQRSIQDPEGFWGEVADEFVWKKKWDKVREYTFEGNVSIKWFIGGKTNISVNALDRHLEKRGDQPAIIWEGNEPTEQSNLTYRQMYTEVCKFANVLKSLGVKKGDRVCLYLQMIPQLPIAMLACARIGAIHSVVFGAFSEDSLRDRIQDSTCKVLVTQDTALARQEERHPDEDQGRRGPGRVPEHREGRGRQAHRRRKCRWRRAATLVARGDGRCRPAVRAGVDGRRGSAVHSLHVGFDRQAEGRAAHHGRLHGLHRDDVQVHLRLPRRRHLVVYGRHRLGHRPLVHRLRPVVHRGDQRSCSKASRPIRTRAASGTWSTSTRSRSSTPRRPRSAP